MLFWLIALSLNAAAQQAALQAMDGDPLPGEHVGLVLALADPAGAPLQPEDPPTLTAARGAVLRLEGELGPGLWSFAYKAPTEGQRDELSIGLGAVSHKASLTLGHLDAPALSVPAFVDGKTGDDDPVAFHVTGPDLPPADRLQVRASEGEVVSVTADAEGLLVQWRPDAERFPRSVPIGIRDGRRPRVAPAWTVVRLKSIATITDRTEPGTEVRIRVSGRTYGPVRADTHGRVAVAVEVRPGEKEGEIERTDKLGNVGRSPISLGGRTQPALAALVESALLAGQRAPLVHVAATKPSGEPWDGDAPACRSSLGDSASVIPTTPGRYLVLLPKPPVDTFFDLRVDCSIGSQVQDSLRVPVASAQPSRLVVRPYPPEVSADFPIAQVQAFLENSLGDRLPSDGINLGADKGEVALDPPEPAVVRGEYRGHAAAPDGKDVLRATWNMPPGEGPLWALDMGVQATHDQIELRGRAIDAQGRPLADRELGLGVLGQGVLGQGVPGQGVPGQGVPGQTGTVRTGARGWAVATLPAPRTPAPWSVSVQSGAIVRRMLVFPGTEVGPDPMRADLESKVDIPILAGRIREVAIWTEPKTLTTGGETARVHVKLTDRAGNAVTDEEIQLEASNGVVTQPKQKADGTFEATFAPPINLQEGTVRITVVGHSSDVKTSTEIEIIPRKVTFAPGLHAGYLLGPPNLYAPWFGFQFDKKLSLKSDLPIFIRLTTGVFVASTEVDTDIGAEPVPVTTSVLHLGVGGLYRWDWVRRAAWLGAGVVVAPYRDSATYDGRQVQGFGVGLPGFSVHSGHGWRLGSGELQLEANYVFLMLVEGDFGWSNLSGVVTTVGYKVLY